MKEQNLRSKLNEVLKKQREEARQNSRKEEGKSIQDCFNELTPSYYGQFVCSLNKSQFLELISELSDLRKNWLWNCLSISELETLYYKLDDLEVLFKNMSIAMVQNFLEGICASTLCDVFKNANHEQKEYIVELVSDEQLEAFLKYSSNSVQQLSDFLKVEIYDKNSMGVLEKISNNMSTELIANCTIRMYRSGSDEIKEDILFGISECEEMTNLYTDLYYELSLEEQMEMLDIMSGRKVMEQYDLEKMLYMLKSAIHILEKKEEHNSMEELYLADLKSKLS